MFILEETEFVFGEDRFFSASKEPKLQNSHPQSTYKIPFWEETYFVFGIEDAETTK